MRKRYAYVDETGQETEGDFFLVATIIVVELTPVAWTLFPYWGEESTMPKSRPPYPPEFRQRIIELVRKGRTPESLAEQLLGRCREVFDHPLILVSTKTQKSFWRRQQVFTLESLEGLSRQRRFGSRCVMPAGPGTPGGSTPSPTPLENQRPRQPRKLWDEREIFG